MPAPLDPQLRREYLARLRREIDAGTYETPEKLAAALDHFLEGAGALSWGSRSAQVRSLEPAHGDARPFEATRSSRP